MKLAISNIAWAPDEAAAVYTLMRQHGFSGLEIAPGLAFSDQDDPMAPSDAAVAAFLGGLDEFSLKPVSMQSLLFGVAGAQLFGSDDELAALEFGLCRAITLANRLDIPNLVFGSPGNRRYPDSMTEAEANAKAIAVFRRLGDLAQSAGAVLAIEPNPAVYNTNFLTTTVKAAEFVLAADHPAVTLNFDLGAIYTNAETAQAVSIYGRAKASHVHISEPQLAPAPAVVSDLENIAVDLIAQGYDRWFSIEMRRPAENTLETLNACLGRAAHAISAARSKADA
jgi:sugar phosphate isomerase/epimerase